MVVVVCISYTRRHVVEDLSEHSSGVPCFLEKRRECAAPKPWIVCLGRVLPHASAGVWPSDLEVWARCDGRSLHTENFKVTMK